MFAIAEAYPFAKVGGLADVGGSLPKVLARLGHDVRLVLPAYPRMGPGQPILPLAVPMGQSREDAVVCYHGLHHGVGVYTVRNRREFDREAIYGYEDSDIAPFVLFSKAVVAFAALTGWVPDIIHCHDWHLGLVPEYARRGPHRAALEPTGTVLTIHNLAYAGHIDPGMEALVGLDGGKSSLLARGIDYADVINTVSQRYLEEILTPEYGMGLDGLLRSRRPDLYGILNGVDYEEFDPGTDPHLPARYDASSLEGKVMDKLALQRASGLAVDPRAPVVGMVARLVHQKGVNLLCAGLDDMVRLGAQMVVAGLGEERYQRALNEAAARHAGSVAHHASSEEALARLVYAGSDFFLAPSAYEPCGLAPLIALRYGSIPIVRRTGGLAETIRDYVQDPEAGFGFTFIRKQPRELTKALGVGLQVYRHQDQWRALQQRAMAADFSWDRSGREYEQLYRQAVVGRRAPANGRVTAIEQTVREARRTRAAQARGAVPLALVHHANQYLIANGYDNRQGISDIVEGYAAVLRLHEKYGVPANLHLSGTLIEALAWHCPWFLALVKDLRARGLVALIGGTYAENVMPLFPPGFNLRQMDEHLDLYHHHLDCPPSAVEVCWVPERVWDTAKLAPVLSSEALANRGYRFVLLDDRLLYPAHGPYAGSPRARFDATGPFSSNAAYTVHRPSAASRPDPAEVHRPYRIAGANGLVMVPISASLRYWVPPSSASHWQHLENTVESLAPDGADATLLVYADDLERVAGVAGWDTSTLGRYDAFLRWVTFRQDIEPVLLPNWLAGRSYQEERVLEPGAYFELAQGWQAGEDYRGWWEDPAWLPYRRFLAAAQDAVGSAQREGAEPRLLALAWKHLLASTYETGWHDAEETGPAPAPWARAVASHARACLVMTAAARWFARGERPPSAEVVDVDQDGEEEVVLCNEHLYAVMSPNHGGRLTYLFSLTTAGGALVVGNPTDDWNWQEELNRYMDRPPNHPGALADVGHERDQYVVSDVRTGATHASVEFTNVQPGSRLHGCRKILLLSADAEALLVCYRAPDQLRDLAVEACLSPDYYRLLREGRAAVSACRGATWQGARTGDVAVWVAIADDERTTWATQVPRDPGHGLTLSLRAADPHFHLVVGCRDTDDETCQRLLRICRDAVHEPDLPEPFPTLAQRPAGEGATPCESPCMSLT